MTRERLFAEAVGIICLGVVAAIVGVVAYELVTAAVWALT